MIVVRCDACGGAVAFDTEHQAVRCLFCAAVALTPEPIHALEQPQVAIPFALGDGDAHRAFRAWTRGSWWRPRALAEVEAELTALWIPAWRVRGEVESHWAGLARASTRSGKRPRAGIDRGVAEVMIPASLGLSSRELVALGGFDEPAARPWQADDAAIPRETPNLTGAGARARAHEAMAEVRRAAIARSEGVQDCCGSARFAGLDQRLLALPVFIGSFRYRDRPWRFVLNGRSAVVVGEAPIDRRKLAVVLAIAVVIAALVLAWLDREPVPSAAQLLQQERQGVDAGLDLALGEVGSAVSRVLLDA